MISFINSMEERRKYTHRDRTVVGKRHTQFLISISFPPLHIRFSKIFFVDSPFFRVCFCSFCFELVELASVSIQRKI